MDGSQEPQMDGCERSYVSRGSGEVFMVTQGSWGDGGGGGEGGLFDWGLV